MDPKGLNLRANGIAYFAKEKFNQMLAEVSKYIFPI